MFEIYNMMIDKVLLFSYSFSYCFSYMCCLSCGIGNQLNAEGESERKGEGFRGKVGQGKRGEHSEILLIRHVENNKLFICIFFAIKKTE